MNDERILKIETLEDISEAEQDLIDRGKYPPGTELRVYVIGNERAAFRFIAPADEAIEIGKVVTGYGSWVLTEQLASSSGEADIEIHMARAIRVSSWL